MLVFKGQIVIKAMQTWMVRDAARRHDVIMTQTAVEGYVWVCGPTEARGLWLLLRLKVERLPTVWVVT